VVVWVVPAVPGLLGVVVVAVVEVVALLCRAPPKGGVAVVGVLAESVGPPAGLGWAPLVCVLAVGGLEGMSAAAVLVVGTARVSAVIPPLVVVACLAPPV